MPTLTALDVGDPPERWRALGFAVSADGVCRLGPVAVRLGGGAPGVAGWSVEGLAPGRPLAGLPEPAPPPTVAAGAPPPHPNGVQGLDHVVALVPDLDAAAAELAAAGLPPRRRREAGSVRQSFHLLGPAILEVVEAAGSPAGFWGLALVAEDLAAVGEWLGPAHDAVQPGRRIATAQPAAGLSAPLAVMTPRRPRPRASP